VVDTPTDVLHMFILINDYFYIMKRLQTQKYRSNLTRIGKQIKFIRKFGHSKPKRCIKRLKGWTHKSLLGFIIIWSKLYNLIYKDGKVISIVCL